MYYPEYDMTVQSCTLTRGRAPIATAMVIAPRVATISWAPTIGGKFTSACRPLRSGQMRDSRIPDRLHVAGLRRVGHRRQDFLAGPALEPRSPPAVRVTILSACSSSPKPTPLRSVPPSIGWRSIGRRRAAPPVPGRDRTPRRCGNARALSPPGSRCRRSPGWSGCPASGGRPQPTLDRPCWSGFRQRRVKVPGRLL